MPHSNPTQFRNCCPQLMFTAAKWHCSHKRTLFYPAFLQHCTNLFIGNGRISLHFNQHYHIAAINQKTACQYHSNGDSKPQPMPPEEKLQRFAGCFCYNHSILFRQFPHFLAVLGIYHALYGIFFYLLPKTANMLCTQSIEKCRSFFPLCSNSDNAEHLPPQSPFFCGLAFHLQRPPLCSSSMLCSVP